MSKYFYSIFLWILLHYPRSELEDTQQKMSNKQKTNPPPSHKDLAGIKTQKLSVQRSLYHYLGTFSLTSCRRMEVENSLKKYNRNGKTKLAQKETTEWIPVTDEKWHLNAKKKKSPKRTWTVYKDFVVEYCSFVYCSVSLRRVSRVKARDRQSLQVAHWEKKSGNFGSKRPGFVNEFPEIYTLCLFAMHTLLNWHKLVPNPVFKVL